MNWLIRMLCGDIYAIRYLSLINIILNLQSHASYSMQAIILVTIGTNKREHNKKEP
jgi:hypothetical protein